MVSSFQRKQYQSHHRRPLHRAPGMGQGTTPDVSPHSPQATSLPTQKTQIRSISQPSNTHTHTHTHTNKHTSTIPTHTHKHKATRHHNHTHTHTVTHTHTHTHTHTQGLDINGS